MTKVMAGTHSVMMIMIKMIKKMICFNLNNKMNKKNCLNYKIMIQRTRKTKMKLSLSTMPMLKTRLKTKMTMRRRASRSLNRMIKTRMKTRMKK